MWISTATLGDSSTNLAAGGLGEIPSINRSWA